MQLMQNLWMKGVNPRRASFITPDLFISVYYLSLESVRARVCYAMYGSSVVTIAFGVVHRWDVGEAGVVGCRRHAVWETRLSGTAVLCGPELAGHPAGSEARGRDGGQPHAAFITTFSP